VLVLTRKTLNSRARWAVPPLAPPPSSTWPACFQPIDSGQEILGKDDIYKPLKCGINCFQPIDSGQGIVRKDDIYKPLKCGINCGVSAKEKSTEKFLFGPGFF
jgi:hypothetical protein